MYVGVVGFSDDDLLLAPSFSALQEMIKITNSYCEVHGMVFSMDKDPDKSKTKCIGWVRKNRELSSIFLGDNRHLGLIE